MSEEKDTIDFLTSKIKQLELDVQYELHQTNRVQQKYDHLKAKLHELINLLSSES